MKKTKTSGFIYLRWFGIRLAMVLFDVLAVNFSYWLAFLIRFYVNHELLEIATVYLEPMRQFLPYYTICCLIVFFCFKLYSGLWKYAGLNDMNRIIFANLITAVIHVVGTLAFIRRMPITYYLLGALIQFMLIAASRFSYRLVTSEITKLVRKRNRTAINVMIVGVGETGRIVRKKIESDHNNAARPVCLFTDKSNESSAMMDGIPVVSGMEKLNDYIRKYHVDCVILADSLLSDNTRKRIKSICTEADIGVQDFSGYFQSAGGAFSFKKLMEYAVGSVEIVTDGKSQTFSSGEQALMSVTGQYEIKSVFAHENHLVVELSKHMVVLNNVNESWVHEFEQETGESVSFF